MLELHTIGALHIISVHKKFIGGKVGYRSCLLDLIIELIFASAKITRLMRLL